MMKRMRCAVRELKYKNDCDYYILIGINYRMRTVMRMRVSKKTNWTMMETKIPKTLITTKMKMMTII